MGSSRPLGFSGGGRDRYRRGIPDRDDSIRRGGSSSGSSSSNNPPSRHLWVGNLSHDIVEADLADQFLRFGELESVAFQPGRSYAFVNFKCDMDAIAALKSLQGFPLAGNPLRIEFAKADKSSITSRDDDRLLRRDEQNSMPRGSSFSHRESGVHSASPDSFYSDRSKSSEKSGEPSEVLWLGFPAQLKVDEVILRKAFSPFGEIEKISVFPGRTYAFIRFRSISSALRAKDTLQGKLFGNPRVSICFAKSETGSSSSGRTPLSPRFRLDGRSGAHEDFWQEPDSPRFMPNSGRGDSVAYRFNRESSLHSAGSHTFDIRRYEESRPPPDIYERGHGPSRERDPGFPEIPHGFSRKSPVYEEPWDLPEETYPFHVAKKLKTGPFPSDTDLPEYPFSDMEQDRRAFPRAFSSFSQQEAFDKNFEGGPFSYRQTPEHSINNLPLHREERHDHFKAPYDSFPTDSGSLYSNPVVRKRMIPEPEKSTLNMWKWEGTIAKGGTPICRARCFPVKKEVPNIILPEFLDCTARTGLDMLSKHYYQAESSWVLFFVPASDTEIEYYNEFMHYLKDKQRAAVAKLDDATTLFLVPPSEFSQKVLKVVGDMSISGLVLRLEHPASHYAPSDPNMLPFHGNASYPKPPTPSGHFPSSFPGPAHVGHASDSYDDRHEYLAQQRDPQNLMSGNRHMPQDSNQDLGAPLIMGLQPQQLEQLASSLLVQQRQLGNNQSLQVVEDRRQLNTTTVPNDHVRSAQTYGSSSNYEASSEIPASQFGQLQPAMTPSGRRDIPSGHPGTQQTQTANVQDDPDADPQKRLQATLQLAAALLQQIQQGKGN